MREQPAEYAARARAIVDRGTGLTAALDALASGRRVEAPAPRWAVAVPDVPDAAEIAAEIVSEVGDLIDDRLRELPFEVVDALFAEAEQRSLEQSRNGDRLALPVGEEEDDDD
jgi:hypothetical protein